MYTYGLTIEEVEEMARQQDNACAICLKVKRLGVDHDHETGRVRGLLCWSCNLAVGWLERTATPNRTKKSRVDDLTMSRALTYLKDVV